MESLHAPWRISYILSPKPPKGAESLFTRIAQSDDDITNLVVHRDRHCFVLMNRYPYNGGHLMVVPYKETSELEDLDDTELSALMLMTRRSIRVLKAVMDPDGFNVGLNLGKVAGAGIEEHLHYHVVPRWSGDSNFMPVIAHTGVVPEALMETAAKIREAFPHHP
ncbi:MAG: AP-4-A phosphorylase [Verrucomicrobia subdivision 3 bacterium]|nr:AP-4-A phosphorylase [Limisphaerales bacterium]MCS1414826.1 AP-4-A phosphorylase [Limisphaerales bacterium]